MFNMLYTLYHGTTSLFSGKFELIQNAALRLENGEVYATDAAAFFLTDDFLTAQLFADSRSVHKQAPPMVLQADVQLFSPLDLRITDDNLADVKNQYPNCCNFNGLNPIAMQEFERITHYSADSWNDLHQMLDDKNVIDALQMSGHDAVILRENNGATSFCIFDTFSFLTAPTACPLY